MRAARVLANAATKTLAACAALFGSVLALSLTGGPVRVLAREPATFTLMPSNSPSLRIVAAEPPSLPDAVIASDDQVITEPVPAASASQPANWKPASDKSLESGEAWRLKWRNPLQEIARKPGKNPLRSLATAPTLAGPTNAVPASVVPANTLSPTSPGNVVPAAAWQHSAGVSKQVSAGVARANYVVLVEGVQLAQRDAGGPSLAPLGRFNQTPETVEEDVPPAAPQLNPFDDPNKKKIEELFEGLPQPGNRPAAPAAPALEPGRPLFPPAQPNDDGDAIPAFPYGNPPTEPENEADCKRIYNERNCCADNAKCKMIQQKVRDRPITNISLDITPPFKPDTSDTDDASQPASMVLAATPARDWKNRRGQVVATGRFADYQKGRVIIAHSDGRNQSVPLRDLSDDDACFVAAWWGLPSECDLGDEQFAGRNWLPLTFTWKASALCHKPLYFEQVQLERYGHDAGPLFQPFLSGAHFFLNVAAVPYRMGINPPWECQYALGYYRPGSCAPWLVPPIPLSVRGGLIEAGVITGGTFIIP